MSTQNLFAVKLIRRGIPTAELLADVRAVAVQLQTDRLSTHRYNQLGRFNATTVMRRLGSWTIAHLFHVSRPAALRDLRRVARNLNTKSPTLAAYRAHGRFTPDAIRKRFGAWHRALLAAGLQPLQYRSLTDRELFDNLKKAWRQLRRQPRIADLRPPLSLCTAGPYLTRFGTWSKTLRAFEAVIHPQLAARPLPPRRRLRVTTHISWRLRCRILQRDHFRCRACGRSPATDPAVKLQIDHIHPRSQGGKSTADNLQTLCDRCNSGKGDLTAGAH